LLLSVIVGILVVIQGGVNAQLGVLLNNSLLATFTTLSVSAIITFFAVIASFRGIPKEVSFQAVPTYMWFLGGVLSFISVSLFYFIIPRTGISTVVTFGLAGQLVFASIASHFGWFNMPIELLSFKKVVGIIILIVALFLIKS